MIYSKKNQFINSNSEKINNVNLKKNRFNKAYYNQLNYNNKDKKRDFEEKNTIDLLAFLFLLLKQGQHF